MVHQSENPLHSVLADLSRRYEPDRFVAALITPQPARTALLAIAAFGAELARISFEVSDPALAQIRLQWWRDALAQPGHEELAAHPVGKALSALLSEHERLPDDGELALLIDQTLQTAQEFAFTGRANDPSITAVPDGNGVTSAAAPYAPGATSIPAGSSLAKKLPPVAKIEALLFRQSVSVLSSRSTQTSGSSEVIDACILAGRAYGSARLAFLNRQYNHNNQSVVANGQRHELIIASRRDAMLAKSALARLKCDVVPAFHPLALVEPYLRLSACASPRIAHALSATLPLRRMWRITQAHFGRRF